MTNKQVLMIIKYILLALLSIVGVLLGSAAV